VTLAHYLDLLGNAGLIQGLQKYAGQQHRRRASAPKLNVLNTETGEMNFVLSRFAPHYRAYVMDKNELEIMEEMPWGPVDDDGRQAQSYFDRDGVIFKLRKYTTGMVTSSSRRAGGVITGLSGDQNSASA
jgi:hypothetical protein